MEWALVDAYPYTRICQSHCRAFCSLLYSNGCLLFVLLLLFVSWLQNHQQCGQAIADVLLAHFHDHVYYIENILHINRFHLTSCVDRNYNQNLAASNFPYNSMNFHAYSIWRDTVINSTTDNTIPSHSN